jgi:hypothetical protein
VEWFFQDRGHGDRQAENRAATAFLVSVNLQQIPPSSNRPDLSQETILDYVSASKGQNKRRTRTDKSGAEGEG